MVSSIKLSPHGTTLCHRLCKVNRVRVSWHELVCSGVIMCLSPRGCVYNWLNNILVADLMFFFISFLFIRKYVCLFISHFVCLICAYYLIEKWSFDDIITSLSIFFNSNIKSIIGRHWVHDFLQLKYLVGAWNIRFKVAPNTQLNFIISNKKTVTQKRVFISNSQYSMVCPNC